MKNTIKNKNIESIYTLNREYTFKKILRNICKSGSCTRPKWKC